MEDNHDEKLDVRETPFVVLDGLVEEWWLYHGFTYQHSLAVPTLLDVIQMISLVVIRPQ
jgi:hypothetical protein